MARLTRTHLKELPLRPYPGYVLVTRNRKAFERASLELFGIEDRNTGTQNGRFRGGSCWYHPFTYLVWYSTPETLAHELSHVILDIFEVIGADPRCGGGEPFCYLLSQLILEANQK
jgi:glycine/D-amino acid oxidase-like deaminating enzyme